MVSAAIQVTQSLLCNSFAISNYGYPIMEETKKSYFSIDNLIKLKLYNCWIVMLAYVAKFHLNDLILIPLSISNIICCLMSYH